MDRLFVPLSSEPFNDFKFHNKLYELRSYGRNFTEEYACNGRKVELRRGYSGESLFGVIGEVVIGTIEEVFSKLDFKKIEPRLNSIEEAIQENTNRLGRKERYIAFQIILNNK